jgi:N-acylglucosamine-6-phosphate 2-epimerase
MDGQNQKTATPRAWVSSRRIGSQNSGRVDDLKGGLIVSCQVLEESPLNRPDIISAMAEAAQAQGAVGVRINGDANIKATRKRVKIPIIGIEKLNCHDSPVYITPTFDSLRRVVDAGADIVAVDFTLRTRPSSESLEEIVDRAQRELDIPLMADVATLDEGLEAHKMGAALIATTLYGYTEQTSHVRAPGFTLLSELVARVDTPVILEGGVRKPEDVQRAFSLGAHSVVVGTVITNLEWLVQHFVEACPRKVGTSQIEFERP